MEGTDPTTQAAPADVGMGDIPTTEASATAAIAHESQAAPAAPAKYTPMARNVFVERRARTNPDHVAVCRCEPESGCGEGCENRNLGYLCGKHCPCGDRCTNGSLTTRQGANVEVFWTGEKGWGLRAVDDIPEGHFIIDFRGEIVSTSTYARRLETVYLSRNNYYFIPYDSGEVIDAGLRGNDSRFINHSCSPNTGIYKFQTMGMGSEEFEFGFWSLRYIVAGEELAFDYSNEVSLSALDAESEEIYHRTYNLQPCACGNAECAGHIGKREPAAQTLDYLSADKGKGRALANGGDDNAQNRLCAMPESHDRSTGVTGPDGHVYTATEISDYDAQLRAELQAAAGGNWHDTPYPADQGVPYDNSYLPTTEEAAHENRESSVGHADQPESSATGSKRRGRTSTKPKHVPPPKIDPKEEVPGLAAPRPGSKGVRKIEKHRRKTKYGLLWKSDAELEEERRRRKKGDKWLEEQKAAVRRMHEALQIGQMVVPPPENPPLPIRSATAHLMRPRRARKSRAKGGESEGDAHGADGTETGAEGDISMSADQHDTSQIELALADAAAQHEQQAAEANEAAAHFAVDPSLAAAAAEYAPTYGSSFPTSYTTDRANYLQPSANAEKRGLEDGEGMEEGEEKRQRTDFGPDDPGQHASLADLANIAPDAYFHDTNLGVAANGEEHDRSGPDFHRGDLAARGPVQTAVGTLNVLAQGQASETRQVSVVNGRRRRQSRRHQANFNYAKGTSDKIMENIVKTKGLDKLRRSVDNKFLVRSRNRRRNLNRRHNSDSVGADGLPSMDDPEAWIRYFETLPQQATDETVDPLGALPQELQSTLEMLKPPAQRWQSSGHRKRGRKPRKSRRFKTHLTRSRPKLEAKIAMGEMSIEEEDAALEAERKRRKKGQSWLNAMKALARAKREARERSAKGLPPPNFTLPPTSLKVASKPSQRPESASEELSGQAPMPLAPAQGDSERLASAGGEQTQTGVGNDMFVFPSLAELDENAQTLMQLAWNGLSDPSLMSSIGYGRDGPPS